MNQQLQQQATQINVDELFMAIGELYLQVRLANRTIAQLREEIKKLKEEKHGDKI